MIEKITHTVGRASSFGGPTDTGVTAVEGLALIELHEAFSPLCRGLFLDDLSTNKGLARQLNPRAFYCAMRWDYNKVPRSTLLRAIVRVTAGNGKIVWARPADWGPNARLDRVIDLSPGAMQALGIKTDAIVTCELFV